MGDKDLKYYKVYIQPQEVNNKLLLQKVCIRFL